jgi:hypothetical protein
MLEADAAVQAALGPAGAPWSATALAAGDAFFAAKEQLWRGAWRRGLGRHIFRFDWKVPAWYADYARQRQPTALPPPAPAEA